MSTEPSPREVDIAFSTPMVQAERAGRKSVTRRILKPQPPPWANDPQMAVGQWLHFHGHHPPKPCGHTACSCSASDAPAMWTTKLRYKVGDILRVREAAWMWCEKVPDGLTKTKRPKFRYVAQMGSASRPIYCADTSEKPETRFTSKTQRKLGSHSHGFGYRLKIPRFLPRWAVRTMLRVTSVRVERLNNITEEDAIREGIEPHPNGGYRNYGKGCEHVGNGQTARSSFCSLWDSINGEGSWNASPWVARIEFERHEPKGGGKCAQSKSDI